MRSFSKSSHALDTHQVNGLLNALATSSMLERIHYHHFERDSNKAVYTPCRTNMGLSCTYETSRSAAIATAIVARFALFILRCCPIVLPACSARLLPALLRIELC